MVPQNQGRPQQNMPPSFMPANSVFDPSPYFNNLDPTQAAKQMAALTAASQARIANSRPAPLLTSSGTNSAPFLGGINTSNYPAANHDSLPASSTAHATFQMQNTHPLSQAPISASLFDPTMSQASLARNPGQPLPLKQRQLGFLNGLASVMAKRNTPLPPTLTGVSVPNYDPSASLWKNIESSEIGSFRLAGKDIELFKLWGMIFQSGGGPAVTANNGWAAVAAHLGLPDDIPQANGGSISSAQAISQYYFTMLLPFEEYYKRNLQDQHKRAQAQLSRQGGQGPQHPLPPNQGRPMQGIPNSPAQGGQSSRATPGNPAAMINQAPSTSHNPLSAINGAPQPQSLNPQPHTPQTSHQGPSVMAQPVVGASNTPSGLPIADSMVNGSVSEANVLEETQGIKRKLEFDAGENKRQKTGSEPPEDSPGSLTKPDRGSAAPMSSASVSTTTTMAPRIRQQPSRRKIEYVPLAREVETYGGRDLRSIESEMANLLQRRPLRDVNDWGIVDIEALTMSIRSRLSTELSYALTTFTLISTMRGQTPGSGFPIFQSADLLDEALDLLEEQAFGDVEDSNESNTLQEDYPIITNRALVNMIIETQSQPFAVLQPHQGSKDPDLGPRQRSGNIILAVLNIIRNLAAFPDNVDFISRHTRLVDLMLRLCTLTKEDPPTPASPALSLNDLVVVRKDTLYTLASIAGNIHLSNAASSTTFRMASRAFQLVSSYLIDPTEAISPVSCMQLAGIPQNGNIKPPLLADIALEVFTKLSQADSNRQVFAKTVPQASIFRLFEALVHRLPIVDGDFHLVLRETWLSYVEKTIMAIYSIAFLAPPSMKQKVKADRTLAFKSVMLRMVQKFLVWPNNEGRATFSVCTKRAIEAMKVLDDAEDSFDNYKSTAPTMSFGMGYGEVGDNSTERGTGLLGGHRDAAWDLMMLREVHADPVMFGELESLTRIEC